MKCLTDMPLRQCPSGDLGNSGLYRQLQLTRRAGSGQAVHICDPSMLEQSQRIRSYATARASLTDTILREINRTQKRSHEALKVAMLGGRN